MADVAVLPSVVVFGRAADTFVATYERIQSDHTARSYRTVLDALTVEFGETTPVAVLDQPGSRERLHAWFRGRYRDRAPATYCQRLAALQSACKWWRLQGWLTTDPTKGLTRPKIPRGASRVVPERGIEQIFQRKNIALRERTLWKLLYDTAARADEILSLNVEDLELHNKRAYVRGKGGSDRWVHWQTGTALLLPRLLDGRRAGPVFLATAKPARAVPNVDLCPETGRARLSYRRAAEIFKAATGFTLHQLRHSALSHDADQGTGGPMLQARSGHQSLRSLERYVRVSDNALARHVAENDPARRRK